MMVLALLVACGGSTGDKADDTAGGDTASGDVCEELSTVTFETFGAGFMTENCMACHASTSANRNGAPDDVIFDDPAAAEAGTASPGEVDAAATWAWADRILARAAVDPPTMPPMGGTSDDDRTLLYAWLTCATPGT